MNTITPAGIIEQNFYGDGTTQAREDAETIIDMLELDYAIIPYAQHAALMAVLTALEQCVDDFGETGQCVCQQAKEQAIAALAKASAAGIDREEKT